MFNVTVDDSKLTLFVDFSSRRMVQYVKQGINKAGIETASYVVSRHLTGGTTEDRLGVRSNRLRASARGLKAVITGDRVVGGAGFGANLVYAPVHINNEGHKSIITANKGMLAIPFRGWSSRTGDIGYGRTKKSGPKDYPSNFFNVKIKTKKGGLILAHKVKGKNARIEPYYLLLKQVEVPARVYPERVAIVRRRYIVETIKNEMMKVFQRKTP
jgi:hypothetical protein